MLTCSEGMSYIHVEGKLSHKYTLNGYCVQYIPYFRCSKVEIVDGIEIHILSVPGKGSLPHSDVEIRRVDSWYAHSMLI